MSNLTAPFPIGQKFIEHSLVGGNGIGLVPRAIKCRVRNQGIIPMVAGSFAFFDMRDLYPLTDDNGLPNPDAPFSGWAGVGIGSTTNTTNDNPFCVLDTNLAVGERGMATLVGPCLAVVVRTGGAPSAAGKWQPFWPIHTTHYGELVTPTGSFAANRRLLGFTMAPNDLVPNAPSSSPPTTQRTLVYVNGLKIVSRKGAPFS